MIENVFFNRGKKRSKVLSLLIVFSFLLSFFPAALSLPTNVQAAGTLNVYPAPSGVPMNTTYTVQVQVPGGPWQSLDVYQTTVNGYTSSKTSFAYFDTDGAVNISVTSNIGSISTAVIRPAANNITPTINGNTMTFSISGPMNISAEVNGDANNTLDLFANPVDPNPPSPTDPNVIYVGPGLYTQDYVVPSGKTLYIAGGAVIQGGISLDNATNAKVLGRGVILNAPYRAIEVDHANQITIDGIIVNDYGNANNGGYAINIGNSTNVSVNNFKAYSFKRWTDGIDIFASQYVTINNYFARTGDDAIAIYGARNFGGNNYSGNTAHISVTNSFLMPDVAHPINVGTHGDPSKPGGGETIEDLNFSNITIWQKNGSKYISLTASDGLLVNKVKLTDITIEDENQGRFIEVLTFKNNGFGLAYGRGVNDVYVKNVSYTGTNANTNNIYGKFVNQLTQNVTFENLKVNGNVVTSASAGNFAIGSYASNINFIASGGTVPAPTAIPFTTPVDIARGKTATADSSQSGHAASSGNDGSTTTRWTANDGNTGHSWVTDLGSPMNITGGTQVMWELSGAAYKYKIETSNDNVNWNLKVDKTSNTDTNQVQNDAFQGTARYVRITVTGLTSGAWASFYDFKVFGDPTNLALGQAVTADSSKSGNPASSGIDANAATLWSANDGNTGHWLTVDLGYAKKITSGTQVSWAQSGVAYQYKIETSLDNTNWTMQVDKTGNTDTSQVQNDYFTGFARYVRITVTGMPSGAWASFYDFKLFGDPTNLALGETITADSSLAGKPASNANDGDTSTYWTAADSNGGHSLTVDLGSNVNITGGTQVMWQNSGVLFNYTLSTSPDNINWTVRIDKGSNNNTEQVQSDYFTGTTRYVKIIVTGVPSGYSASIADFKVFGSTGGDNQTMAQLPFNQTSGTTAYDVTSNGWNGTLVNGASWAAGGNGSNAVSLNGTNQYVALPSGVVAGDNAITVAAWVNLNSVSNWSRIFDFGSGTNSYMFLSPKNAVTNKIRFAIKLNGSSEQIIDGTAALPTGGWHHVAVTLNGSTGMLYVDGQQVGSNTAMTIKPSDLGVTTQNWIGRSQFSTDPYLNGMVQDFRIYNRALAASNITQVMNGETALLFAKLPFNETSGTTASDATGNGWNGTLVNGATWAAGRNSSNAVSLSGTSQYVSIPSGVISSYSNMTITAWVNLNTVSNWMRIFDFGTGTTNYMYLSPQNGVSTTTRSASQ